MRRFRSGVIPKQIPPGLAPKTVRNIHAMHLLRNDDRDAAEQAAAFLLGDLETVANADQDDSLS